MTRVFVYGTLLKGQGNHRILGRAEFQGEAMTRPEFTMISCGGFPAILRDGGTAIKGEVYEVSQNTLLKLDELEGLADGHYIRKIIQLQDGTEAQAYMYAKDPRTSGRCYPEIKSGDWKEWSSWLKR